MYMYFKVIFFLKKKKVPTRTRTKYMSYYFISTAIGWIDLAQIEDSAQIFS